MRVGLSGAEGIFGWLLTSLLRRNAPVLVRSSGVEYFASTRLTCSLVHPPLIAPTLQLGIVGSSGATWPSPTCAANCTDATASVYPMPTGYSGATASVHPVLLVSTELVHFIISLSSFFVFRFAWPFCFIPGIYNCSLDKLISPIDCIVTQSPKSQNNGLMGPCSLQQVKRQKE